MTDSGPCSAASALSVDAFVDAVTAIVNRAISGEYPAQAFEDELINLLRALPTAERWQAKSVLRRCNTDLAGAVALSCLRWFHDRERLLPDLAGILPDEYGSLELSLRGAKRLSKILDRMQQNKRGAGLGSQDLVIAYKELNGYPSYFVGGDAPSGQAGWRYQRNGIEAKLDHDPSNL